MAEADAPGAKRGLWSDSALERWLTERRVKRTQMTMDRELELMRAI